MEWVHQLPLQHWLRRRPGATGDARGVGGGAARRHPRPMLLAGPGYSVRQPKGARLCQPQEQRRHTFRK